MSSGMNTEQAKEYAKTMTYTEAVSNIKHGKGIKYRKATMIKLRELAEIADRLDRKTENSSEKPNNSTISKMEQVEDEPQTEPNLILPERMERGEMYEVGDSIVVMNSEDYYDLLCKSWEKDEPQTELVNDSPILVKDLVDDEFNPHDEECMRCKHLKLQCEFVPSYCKYEPRDETQTEEPPMDEYYKDHDEFYEPQERSSE